MESIGACDAKTRLNELLERVSRREAFRITKHGPPIVLLVPIEEELDRGRIDQAAERLKTFYKDMPKVSLQELIGARHEGHCHS